MKNLVNKQTDIQLDLNYEAKAKWSDFAKFILNDPGKGITFEEQGKRISLIERLGEMRENLDLEDEDVEVLKRAIASKEGKWSMGESAEALREFVLEIKKLN